MLCRIIPFFMCRISACLDDSEHSAGVMKSQPKLERDEADKWLTVYQSDKQTDGINVDSVMTWAYKLTVAN